MLPSEKYRFAWLITFVSVVVGGCRSAGETVSPKQLWKDEDIAAPTNTRFRKNICLFDDEVLANIMDLMSSVKRFFS